ncbi:MAG: DNA primase [Pantoea sp. Brub]|nr:DNA primase [Pantoea sp. Brub]
MAKRISKIFINNLLSYTDITNFINIKVNLNKKGKNYYAYCPFHKERTPSFVVNSEKQFFYCFGCGIHGNIIDFIMNYEKITFVEAIEELAAFNNISISYENCTNFAINSNCQRLSLYQLNDKINTFYRISLKDINAKYAKDYLINRGLSNEIIDFFEIGYAPVGLDNILKYVGNKPENRELLIITGTLANNNNNIYDRFRERIIFPIRDKIGRIIGFGGRTLKNITPKYINSPKTPIFNKSRCLYGLYEALKINKKPNYLLLVEGFIDVISLVQHNINFVVSQLGTSITSEHIQQLFCNTENIICCYDGDTAGYEAAWKTLKVALPYMYDGRQLRFMFLPEGEDPDTLIRKEGTIFFKKRIKESIPLSSFLFDKLLMQVNLNCCDSKAKLSSLALPLISQIPGNTLRMYMRQKLGYKLGILDDNQLEKIMPKLITNNKLSYFSSFKFTTIRILLSLLVQNPQLSILVPSFKNFLIFKISGLSIFIELVKQCNKYPGLNTGQLLELYRGTKFSHMLETLSVWNHMIVDEQTEIVFKDSLNNIYNILLKQQLESLITLERTQGLSSKERHKFWTLSKYLAKK